MPLHAIVFLSDFLKSCYQSGRSASGSFEFFLSSLFRFCFWISGKGTSLLDASSSLRSDTELEDELEAGGTSSLVALSASFLNASCDGDAEDELLSGLVDYPGTARGTKLSVLQMMVFPSLANRGF